MILQNYMKTWGTYYGLLTNAMFVVTLLLALSTQSCGRLKEVRRIESHAADSITDRMIVTVRALNVPLTQAALRLNLSDLQTLTTGAVFTEKNGQASVRAERKDSIIIITATCDSLQLLVESQTREIYHLRTQLEKKHTEIEKHPGWWETFKNNAFYIAVGMFLMLVINLIRKIWKKIHRLPLNL